MESVPGDPREAGERFYGVDGLGGHQREDPQAAGLHHRVRGGARLGCRLPRNPAVHYVSVEEGT